MCGFLVTTDFEPQIDMILEEASKLHFRGPDNTTIKTLKNSSTMMFHRLKIMDLSSEGDQPFTDIHESSLVCNGEIYNHQAIRAHELLDYSFKSDSDCEVILPLIERLGIKKSLERLDGEFAFVCYHAPSGHWMAARDPLGIRPLFYGFSKQTKKIIFASEMKALIQCCDEIRAFPPGHYYLSGKFVSFLDLARERSRPLRHTESEATQTIRELLIAGVEKRLDSDAPLGFLLSGGLDSSLVCSIAAKKLGKITTFSVGIKDGPIDTKYARIVADYLGSEHHEVLFEKSDIFRILGQLIYQLETYDITTIRASVGMYLVCEYVKKHTDIKVILTGEVSDEIFGYKYTDFAPSSAEFQKEAQKRIREIYMYDVLRADRCISSHSLEARVPFSDKHFVDYVMSLDPALKMNFTGTGKYLLRKAFDDGTFLPHEILYRDKAAFSDAVGHSVVDYLKAFAEETYTDQDLSIARFKYKHACPHTKEALLYRDIFEGHFPDMSYLVKDFWMPNKEWENCDVDDPSARVLPNYGASGA